MWTVVFVSRDKLKIDKILSLLENNKIITMLRKSNQEDFDSDGIYEVLVPRTEIEPAHEIIFDSELEK